MCGRMDAGAKEPEGEDRGRQTAKRTLNWPPGKGPHGRILYALRQGDCVMAFVTFARDPSNSTSPPCRRHAGCSSNTTESRNAAGHAFHVASNGGSKAGTTSHGVGLASLAWASACSGNTWQRYRR
jgi:hypothetical protein